MSTRFITLEEYKTTTIAELDNVTYHKIEAAMAKSIGERIAKRILMKSLEKTIQQMSLTSCYDILSVLTILN